MLLTPGGLSQRRGLICAIGTSSLFSDSASNSFLLTGMGVVGEDGGGSFLLTGMGVVGEDGGGSFLLTGMGVVGEEGGGDKKL